MKIHKAIVRHSFIHFLFSFFLFLSADIYTADKDPGLFYFFGYFSCLTFFTMVLPLFVSDKIRNEAQMKPYFAGTIIILFVNIFVPFIGGFCSRYFYDFFLS